MEFEFDLPQKIVDLLVSAGYSRACDSSLSVFDKITGGLAWCISRCNTNSGLCVASDSAACLQDQLKVCEIIGVALRSVGCPHPLETHQIQGLDYDHVYPVLEWIVNRITSMRENMRDEKNADPHAQSNEAGERLHTDEHSSDLEALEQWPSFDIPQAILMQGRTRPVTLLGPVPRLRLHLRATVQSLSLQPWDPLWTQSLRERRFLCVDTQGGPRVEM
ncbi:Coiled-coil domain-containing protein 93 [Nymphaea thermarum]|nr:Coiled-coil domain-containing protein 93 [Nymphaea thermarum]